MQFGAGLNMDWHADIAALRGGVIALDEAGFDYVQTSGHLLTARAGRYPNLPPVAYSQPYRDPFVLFGHLAAITRRVSFRTGILILPMFPTALVAKQAADLSLLSANRFQLGVGISWQAAEYQALGQPMRERGAKLEEQISVLRMLWSQPLVTYKGRYHDLDDIGIGQLPDKPIPIWIGSGSEASILGRAARLADGWLPPAGADPVTTALLQRLVSEAGRPQGIGIAGRVTAGPDVDRAIEKARSQIGAGATELTISARPGTPLDEGVAAIIATRDGLRGDLTSPTYAGS